MKVAYEYGRYVLGHKCSCGWTAGPFDSVGPYGIPMPTFAFHSCCPLCGNFKHNIAQLPGRYLFKIVKKWFGLITKEERIKFVVKGEEHNLNDQQ